MEIVPIKKIGWGRYIVSEDGEGTLYRHDNYPNYLVSESDPSKVAKHIKEEKGIAFNVRGKQTIIRALGVGVNYTLPGIEYDNTYWDNFDKIKEYQDMLIERSRMLKMRDHVHERLNGLMMFLYKEAD